MYSRTPRAGFTDLCFVIYLCLSLSPVSAQESALCANCFYGPSFCDPVTHRCIYGCSDGWKGDQCLTRCITEGCKHCEVQSNGIEQCVSCYSSGVYGPLCNLRCSPNCKRYDGDNTCDHFGNCIFGCVAPYIGNQCTEQNCPFENCIHCATRYNNHIYCYQCLNGYYWVPTIEKCVPCTSNCRYGITDCDTTSGQCKSGQCLDGWVGRMCDIPCDIPDCTVCKEDSGKVMCITCEQGFFPDKSNNKASCIPCNGNCGDKCDRQTGLCIHGCKTGYYGRNCDQQCTLPYCEECAYANPIAEDRVICTNCSNGFYHDEDTCQMCPVNCHYGNNTTCEFIGGNCLEGCVDGWYGPKCEQSCSKNCVDNKCNSIGSCDCVTGWFGHRCDRSCPIHCLNCNEYVNGVCAICEAGWYGAACDKLCSQNCKPNDYSRYVYCGQDSGSCREGCIAGWYGEDCTMPCSSDCTLSICHRDSGNCSLGCDIHKYGRFCNETCSLHCKNPASVIETACDRDNGKCTYGCADGYFGLGCTQTCPANCFKNCDINTGECLNGCELGYSGKRCDEICTDTCPTACGNNCLHDECDPVTNTCAKGCHTGWYGSRCEMLCAEGCLNRKCDQYSGRCQDGCDGNRYGAECDRFCNENCKIRKCSQMTGVCGDCKDGLYGPDCSLICSMACVNSTCEKWTGHCFMCGVGRQGDFCSDSCPPTFYGYNCETPCGHCKDGGPCYIHNGVCPSGCDIGWTGINCMQALQTVGESSDSNKTMQIAIGCAAGGVFCCFVIILAIWWYKRRKLAKTKKFEEPSVQFRESQVVIGITHQPEASMTTAGDQTSNQSSQSAASAQSQSDPLLGDPQSSQIKLLDVIREGQFYSLLKGEVIKRGTTKQCCVKLLKLKDLREEKYIYRLTLESEILAQCGSHKNIISLIKTYQNADIYCVAIDDCVQTGLLYYLRMMPYVSNENGTMSVDPVNIFKITKFVTDICAAVSHIHDLKVIHRALRAGHIYLNHDRVTKLGDFDWAEWFNMDHTGDTASQRFDLPKKYYHWLSPESSILGEFSYKSDVWSLGLIFWEVFNLGRKTPYAGLNRDDHKLAIRDGIRPSKPSLAHFSLYRIMKNCWRYDPTDRPTSSHLLTQLEMIQASTWTTMQQL